MKTGLLILIIIGLVGYIVYSMFWRPVLHQHELAHIEEKELDHICVHWCEIHRIMDEGITSCVSKCVAAWEATSDEDRNKIREDVRCTDLIGRVQEKELRDLSKKLTDSHCSEDSSDCTKRNNITAEEWYSAVQSVLNTEEKWECALWSTYGDDEWRIPFYRRVKTGL